MIIVNDNNILLRAAAAATGSSRAATDPAAGRTCDLYRHCTARRRFGSVAESRSCRLPIVVDGVIHDFSVRPASSSSFPTSSRSDTETRRIFIYSLYIHIFIIFSIYPRERHPLVLTPFPCSVSGARQIASVPKAAKTFGMVVAGGEDHVLDVLLDRLAPLTTRTTENLEKIRRIAHKINGRVNNTGVYRALLIIALLTTRQVHVLPFYTATVVVRVPHAVCGYNNWRRFFTRDKNKVSFKYVL